MAYDFGVFLVLLFCLYRGAAKGVAWQVAGIGALVLCFIFATPLSSVVAPSIPLEAPLNRWVAMLGIYLFFSFATFAVARGFREILEKAHFQEFDKHLGAIFGVLKGALLTLVFTFFIVAISEKARAYVLTTYTGHFSAIIMDRLNPVMPQELHAILEPYIHSLDEAAKGKLKNRHAAGEPRKGANGDPGNPFDENDEESGEVASSRDLRKSFPNDEEGGDLLGNAIGETVRKKGKEYLEKADEFVFGKTDPAKGNKNNTNTGTTGGKSGYRPIEGGGGDDSPSVETRPIGSPLDPFLGKADPFLRKATASGADRSIAPRTAGVNQAFPAPQSTSDRSPRVLTATPATPPPKASPSSDTPAASLS